MNCRRHGSKPTIALWMLVAVADLAILAATASLVTILLVVAGLVVLAGGVAAVRLLAAPHRTHAGVRPRLLAAPHPGGVRPRLLAAPRHPRRSAEAVVRRRA